ncbi:hypothetical protein AMK59_6823 [Oryctes borbonicus]|uniref:C2H2-type domain-containing protein n=1 Tax=Oryctes borbonicus TaxID=1629725 RepID=A0A0T6B150_9SCAR|nr:hypothetical protein AMK59_6823 [Oryctes borbonicus]
MDSFTCISCRVLFKDGEIQRLHYKTDWHRYNLKRKVAELPPVSFEDFQKRAYISHKETISSQQDTSAYCGACRKSFASQNAYENHLNSKKHKDKLIVEQHNMDDTNYKRDVPSKNEVFLRRPLKDIMEVDIETDSDVEEVDSDEWEDEKDSENVIDTNKCLFCAFTSVSLLNRIGHMSIQHSFFIADVEYCSDIKGLLQYLAEKITFGFMCIWCNEKGRTFHSAEAACSHMIDKGHCKMLHEGITLAEYAEFYDYSSSYPDNSEGVDKDSEVNMEELDDSDYQLVLPSGAVIGHRSLMRYYKQNPERTVMLSKNTKKLHKVLAGYHALGWSATQQEAVARKARDLHHMKRLQSKYNMKLGIKGNNLQKHFRQQTNF